MNKRIRELMIESGIYECNDFEPHPTFEKFAELVVKECMDVLDPGTNQLIARFQARQWLSEHFGVE